MKEAFINLGIVSEDGYVKVRDGLWVASGPYKKSDWDNADKDILGTKEELYDIHLNLKRIIEIQEECGLDSLKQLFFDDYSFYPWAWSKEEVVEENDMLFHEDEAWISMLKSGNKCIGCKHHILWILPIRREV